MQQQRKRRLLWVCAALCCFAVAASLIFYVLRENINLYYTPTQIKHGESPQHHLFRVGGLVKKGSVDYGNDLNVHFTLTDNFNDVQVSYQGILPDLFREGQGIVASGRLDPNNGFIAEEVLAKHDENYMPPEVKDMLEKNRSDK